jgi:hypothetical protein
MTLLLQQLFAIRSALNNAQGLTGELTRAPFVRSYDAILASYQVQKEIAEALKLLGFIESEEMIKK